MSSDCGQLGRALNEDDSLYPYPDQLTEYHFSMSKVFTAKERSSPHIEVEFHLISPIEFTVKTSRVDEYFISNVLKSHRNLKYHTNPKHPNIYELNLKQYKYIYSRVKYCQEFCYMTINHNHFDRHFIEAMMRNVDQNDNIMTFIQNPKSRKSIIESLESDPKFGKTVKIMSKYKMFDDLKDNQIIAFYMSVIRNGKSILADQKGNPLSALTIMTYFRSDWPLVIVCDKQRKQYWSQNVIGRYKCAEKFRISVVDSITDIYVFPKPFHDIMIMDYDLYYEVKDTISFKCLYIKAYIFDDQTRNPSNRRPWKGLSNCIDYLRKANRIIFISIQDLDSEKYKSFWPILTTLDPMTYHDYSVFEKRYFMEHPEDLIWSQIIKEFQILLRSTFWVSDKAFE